MALEIYKKGQGYYTRLGTALGAGVLVVLGCYALYQRLEGVASETGWGNVVRAGVPLLLLAVLAWVIFKVVNTPKLADFMIATEGEMKKVSWSTKKEIITSTKVVIITVLLMAFMLAVVDFVFVLLFRAIGVVAG